MRILFILLFAAAIASAQPKSEKSEKLEVPSPAETAKAELQIKELFRAEYASKKKADAIALAPSYWRTRKNPRTILPPNLCCSARQEMSRPEPAT